MQRSRGGLRVRLKEMYEDFRLVGLWIAQIMMDLHEKEIGGNVCDANEALF